MSSPTSKQIFRDGILSFPFEQVLAALGEDRAVYWGEACAGMGDKITNGNVYPLTGFIFQTTYAAWKEQQTNSLLT